MTPLWLTLIGCPATPTSGTDSPTLGFASVPVEAEPSTGVLLGIWSAGGEALLVGGDLGGEGRITRYDGTRFCVEPERTESVLWWVHGRAEDDWYAVGGAGTVIHQTPDGRIREDLPTSATLYGVFDDGADVWAVGGDPLVSGEGEIWRKPAGGDWMLQLGGIDGLVFKVHDGWFVGDGLAWVWDGDQLVERPLPALPGSERLPRLLTVRSLGPDRALAVGGSSSPVFMQYADGAWTYLPTDSPCLVGRPLNGIFTEAGQDVFLAGNQGSASKWTDGVVDCAPEPLTLDHFHVAWQMGDEVLFAGGDLFSFPDNAGTIAIHPDPGPMPAVETCPPGQ